MDSAPTARTLRGPSSLWTDGERLAVLDERNNRVLIWSSFPTANFQPADLVLGQSAFNLGAGNDTDQDGSDGPGVDAHVFNGDFSGISGSDDMFCLADSLNSRLLLWSSFPTANFQPADVVLGQQDMTLNAQNDENGDSVRDGEPSAKTLSRASGCLFYDNKLIVADESNERTLIYESQ